MIALLRPPVPDGRIVIAIEDTDYENADEVTRATGIGGAEDPLPMSTYLNSMIVIHHDRETDDYVSRDAEVSETDQYHYLLNEYFPEGSNAIMTIGNDNRDASDYPPLGADGRMSDITVDLYPSDTGCKDVFIGRGLVSIPVSQDTVIWMQRATGKLIVQVLDMPADVTQASLHVENVNSGVDWNLQYSGDTDTRKVFDIDIDASDMEINLPPNAEGESSPVTVILRNSDGATVLPAVPVVVERNRITLLQVNYDNDTAQWKFQVLVDGAWQSVEPLELPDN